MSISPGKSIMPLLVALLMSLGAFSQKAVLNNKGDTTICFSVPQAKFLLKKYYQVQMLDSLNSICEKQRLFADSIIQNAKKLFYKNQQMLNNQYQVIVFKDHEISNLNKIITNQNKTIRRQKLYKWLSFIGGVATSSFFAYKYITK